MLVLCTSSVGGMLLLVSHWQRNHPWTSETRKFMVSGSHTQSIIACVLLMHGFWVHEMWPNMILNAIWIGISLKALLSMGGRPDSPNRSNNHGDGNQTETSQTNPTQGDNSGSKD